MFSKLPKLSRCIIQVKGGGEQKKKATKSHNYANFYSNDRHYFKGLEGNSLM
jgi:hypothetical protein